MIILIKNGMVLMKQKELNINFLINSCKHHRFDAYF